MKMSDTEKLLKKAQHINRLLGEVKLYFVDFDSPMPLRILSAKYSRALSKLGGFHPTMTELEADGSVVIERTITGRTLVYPTIEPAQKAG